MNILNLVEDDYGQFLVVSIGSCVIYIFPRIKKMKETVDSEDSIVFTLVIFNLKYHFLHYSNCSIFYQNMLLSMSVNPNTWQIFLLFCL